MASKTEYYDRIISSLQSDIEELRNTTSKLGKEIEIHKLNREDQQSNLNEEYIQNKLTNFSYRIADKFKETIMINFSKLPDWFLSKDDFAEYKKNVEKQYTSADAFRTYCKKQDEELKSLERKLNRRRFTLFTHNTHFEIPYTGPDRHPPLPPTIWQKYRTEIIYFVVTLIMTAALAITYLINDNLHLRREQRLQQTIELINQSKLE